MRNARLRVFTSAITTAIVLVVASSVAFAQASRGSISGTVKDQQGANLSGAQVLLVHPQQAVLQTTTTDANGHFSFDNVAAGAYEIRVTQSGFDTQRVSAQAVSGQKTNLEIILEIAPLSSQVTVTAETGQAQEKDKVPQAINIISETAIQQRTTAVLAQVADEEVGLSLQRTRSHHCRHFCAWTDGK